MEEESYKRGQGRSSAGDPLTAGTRMDSVSSDRLWRAAVLATREAASSAAELRRALDENVSRAAATAIRDAAIVGLR